MDQSSGYETVAERFLTHGSDLAGIDAIVLALGCRDRTQYQRVWPPSSFQHALKDIRSARRAFRKVGRVGELGHSGEIRPLDTTVDRGDST
jgi:hypothetical protein